MHILTGFLLAGLLGKNKFRRRTLMPMLRTGPVQTVHWMPGRVRFRVPSLAENAEGAAMVRKKLPTMQGVRSVKLDPATGSVLIAYREDQVQPELLFAAVVRLMNLEAELKRTAPAGRHSGIEGNPGPRQSDGVRPDRRTDRPLVGRAHSIGRRRHPKSIDTRDAGVSGGAHASLVGPGLAAGRPAVVAACEDG